MSLRSGKSRHGPQREEEPTTTGYQSGTMDPNVTRDDDTVTEATVQATTSGTAAMRRGNSPQGAMGPPARQQLTPATRIAATRPQHSTPHLDEANAAASQGEPKERPAEWEGSLCSRETGMTPHSRCRRRFAEAAKRELQERQRIEEEMLELRQESLQKRLDNLRQSTAIERDLIEAEEEEAEEMRSIGRSVAQLNIPVEKPPIPQWIDNSKQAVLGAARQRQQQRDDVQATAPAATPHAPTACEGILLRQTLPRELPIFDGDPERWLIFVSQLEQQTLSLTPSEVLTRLQRCLKGRAYQAVSSFLFDPEQLPRIREILERRFGRPDLLIGRLINQVRSLRPLTSDSTTSEEIIDFTITVGNLIASLKSLKRPEYAYNMEILRELESKLSGHHLAGWSEAIIEKHEGNPSLFDFSTYMDKIGRQATVVNRANWSAKPKAKVHEGKPAPKRVYATDTDVRDPTPERKKASAVRKDSATVREPNAASDRKGNRPKCIVCDRQGHDVAKCYKFLKMPVSRRSQFAQTSGMCFRCLKRGHFARDCHDSGKTHTLLIVERGSPMRTEPRGRATEAAAAAADGRDSSKAVHTTQGRNLSSKNILLRVIPVTVKGPKGSVEVLALLDEGSSITLLKESVARDVGLKGKKSPLTLKSITGPHQENSRIVSLEIRNKQSDDWYKMTSVRTIEDLQTPEQECSNSQWEKWTHLHGINIPRYQGKTALLIGMDNYRLIAPREIVWGPVGQPTATRSLLGWTISGHVNTTARQEGEVFHATFKEESVEDIVKDYLRTEEAGVVARQHHQKRHERAVQTMAATTRYDNGRWETGLLWRSEEERLPPSRAQAISRLRSLETKLKKEPVTAEAYRAKMREYVEKGYARELTEEEENQRGPRTFYLPHFCVTNPHKPSKIRIVFDAAAKVNNRCLNDALEAGPDLLNPLIGILMKFRERKVAFTADIKEMFLRIKIRQEDQDAQRFLWRDMQTDQEPKTFKLCVMIFGASSSPCSAQNAKNQNARMHEKEFPQAVEPILKRHYMDDYIDSADSEKEAIELARSVTEVHRRGGFELCNWHSNSSAVLTAMEAKSSGNISLNLGKAETAERVLGLEWDPERDILTFNLNFPRVNRAIVAGEKRPTKREMLSLAMSVFDPLGLLSPFTVKAKTLLQEVWRDKTEWDQELSQRVHQKWLKWLKELDSIRECQVPRWYRPVNAADISLHIFCDASETAYAAVAYLVSEDGARRSTSFVASKAKVAPLKPQTIPRMELMAAVIGSRLANTIKQELSLHVKRTVMWTDSTTVIQWIRSDPRRYNVFVAHRLGEIDELTNTGDWRWVPTTENVADEATRDKEQCNLGEQSRWFNGPAFLRQEEEDWPRETWAVESPTEEMRAVFNTHENKRTIEMERFSSWQRLVRSTAYALRFIDRCLRRAESRGGVTLMQWELERATEKLIKQAQEEMFPEEIHSLNQDGTVDVRSRLYSLTPRLNEKGHIVLDGRIGAAKNVGKAVKEPAVLCARHRLSRLLVNYYHRQAAHQGQETVRNNLRQQYWLLGSRNAVRRAARECRTCRLKKVQPGTQQMGRLPAARLAHHVRPFTDCAIDYFGPINVCIGRRREKRYGVLMTCLATRAVHIDIAASLTADSAIQAVVRMAARRGWPKTIYSDNGTNFHGAERELREAWDSIDKDKMSNELSAKGVDWRFIPASAPHMGGSWERMVRSIKTALYAILKEQAPREETLRTALAEAEFVVNSRPITHVSSDHRDEGGLTPNHFLIGPPQPVPQICPSDERTDLRKQWRISQALANQFWRRWVKEYLPTLAKRSKWYKKNRDIAVNDVVFITEPNAARGTWVRGVVTATHPGADGMVRVVDLRTANGRICRRPIAKVAVILEAEKEDTGSVGGEDVAAANKTASRQKI